MIANLRRIFKFFNTIAAIGLLPNLLSAEAQSYTSYGTVGLIDMPTAASDSDGRLILSQSGFDGSRRTSLTAQILPRVSASFRYSAHGRNGNEAVMVAEEPMATEFLDSNTGLWVFGAFILALLASDDNPSSSKTTN